MAENEVGEKNGSMEEKPVAQTAAQLREKYLKARWEADNATRVADLCDNGVYRCDTYYGEETAALTTLYLAERAYLEALGATFTTDERFLKDATWRVEAAVKSLADDDEADSSDAEMDEEAMAARASQEAYETVQKELRLAKEEGASEKVAELETVAWIIRADARVVGHAWASS